MFVYNLRFINVFEGLNRIQIQIGIRAKQNLGAGIQIQILGQGSRFKLILFEPENQHTRNVLSCYFLTKASRAKVISYNFFNTQYALLLFRERMEESFSANSHMRDRTRLQSVMVTYYILLYYQVKIILTSKQ